MCDTLSSNQNAMNHFSVLTIVFFSVFAVENSKRQKRWKEVQPGDLKVFFALHVAMGLIHKPNLKSYWSKDPVTQTPFFGQHMS